MILKQDTMTIAVHWVSRTTETDWSWKRLCEGCFYEADASDQLPGFREELHAFHRMLNNGVMIEAFTIEDLKYRCYWQKAKKKLYEMKCNWNILQGSTVQNTYIAIDNKSSWLNQKYDIRKMGERGLV